MSSPALRSLTGAAAGAQFADQLVLAALPLTAVLSFEASPGLVGLLVAAHAAAWLAVSLPAGSLLDHGNRRRLLVRAQLLAAVAFTAAGAAALSGVAWLLAVATFLGATGVVLFVLGAAALLPSLLGQRCLAAGNARLETARALAALAAPALAGLLARDGFVVVAYGLAAVAALVAARFLARLPDFTAPGAAPRAALLAGIRDGAVFVMRQPVLRAIALCAVFWNFSFFVLTAAFVPFAIERIGLDAAEIGVAQATYGVGALLAGLTGGWLVGRQAPNITLVLGPAVSLLAGVLILAAPAAGAFPVAGSTLHPGLVPAAAGFFLVGFGPVLWLICQLTLRQLLTPAQMLGRVSATIQTAIYGVRPLAAMAGGAVGAWAGLDAAILVATASFAASTLVVLLSPLLSIHTLPAAVIAPAE